MFFRVAVIVLLILLSVSDMKSRTIPMRPVLLFAAVMAGAHIVLGRIPAMQDTAGILPAAQVFVGMLPGLFLLAVSVVSGSSIGSGDGITVAACGAAVGFAEEFVSLAAGLLLCSAYCILLLIRKKAGRKDTLAFLPFLTAGHILVLVTETCLCMR